ncbi:hypothetical protein Ancab_014843 [Ancistrocladus abbreviatus]
MAAASRWLNELQCHPGNRICVDCSQKNPQWASISYVGEFRYSGGGDGGGIGNNGIPVRSKSTEDIYTHSQFEASARNNETFFARKIAENDSRPEGILLMGGLGRLSSVAASAAQSAANVVQAGTKELTSKASHFGLLFSYLHDFLARVGEGGYDYKVNEIVNVVTAKTMEIGQKDIGEHGKVSSTNGVASHGNDGWAGWDDAEDDGFENFYQGASDKKAAGHNEKSDVSWIGVAFYECRRDENTSISHLHRWFLASRVHQKQKAKPFYVNQKHLLVVVAIVLDTGDALFLSS